MPQTLEPAADGLSVFAASDALARDLCRALAEARAEAEALRAELARARTEALFDHLTGLPNRRHFEACVERSEAAETAIAMCDIDDFKLINDRYGHQAGDRVLQIVGSHLRDHLSPNAIVARYGGEEFAALFIHSDAAAAAALVDEARATLAHRVAEARALSPEWQVSFSAGIARSSGGASDAMQQADRALYAAKREGKNRVLVAA